MMSLPAESKVARLEVPASRGRLVLVCFYLFVLSFVAMAVYEVAHFSSMPWSALGASVVWLSFVALLICMAIHEDGGVRQYLVNRLGDFSRRQFVEVDRTAGQAQVRFGYELLGRRYYYLQIGGESVRSVEWSTGQASELAGGDQNDWHVVLWYYRPEGTRWPRYPGMREDEVYVVGPSGPRHEIEQFGRSLVAFLQAAGVALQPTDKPTEFTLTGKTPVTL